MQDQLATGSVDGKQEVPLTRLRGVALDEDGDILLLGDEEEAGNGVSKITCDDIALPMRGMLVSKTPPGVSIDPIVLPAEVRARRKQMQRQSLRYQFGLVESEVEEDVQTVRYFGDVKDTRAGLVFFSCDYWMKEVAGGERSLSLPGFCAFVDRLRRQISDGGHGVGESGTRFWFYPKESRFRVSPDRQAMELTRSGIQLLTEGAHLSRSGIAGMVVGSEAIHESAQAFADQVTARYTELELIWPDLARLRTYAALAEIFKWIDSHKPSPGKWDYLLKKYKPLPTHTPMVAKTIRYSWSTARREFFLIGGVSIEIRLPSSLETDASGKLNGEKKTASTAKAGATAFFGYY